MRNAFSRISILIACLSVVSFAAGAQEIVHALVGTINHVDLAGKTVTVLTEDGSDGTFRDLTDSHVSFEFDKALRSEATPPVEFNKSGVRAIVFYYGVSLPRTVVAIKSLGPGPFKNSTGVVVKYDKHQHVLTVEDQSGASVNFTINQDTVAETDSGVAEGLKFDTHKGEHVRVAAEQVNGSNVALFINGALGL
jgi:hypothetical protein